MLCLMETLDLNLHYMFCLCDGTIKGATQREKEEILSEGAGRGRR